jgi:hypothetical protein
MIKFTSEALTDKVQKELGFSGENEEIIRSPSLNCLELCPKCGPAT